LLFSKVPAFPFGTREGVDIDENIRLGVSGTGKGRPEFSSGSSMKINGAKMMLS